MRQYFTLCVCVLVVYGCERPANVTWPETPDLLTETVQEVVIEGFGDQSSVVVAGQNGVRVGWYHDFSAYDSLRINVAVERLTVGGAGNQIVVKIGPACYLREALSKSREDISILVKPAEIAKSGKAALTFFSSDPEVELRLSQLRVIGWRTL